MLALLIDGLNLVRRIDAAVPGERGCEEHADGVLRSVERSVERALEHHLPSHALAAFDAQGPGWRHALLPQYKAGRPPMPEALVALMPRIEAALEAHGVRCVRVTGFEADDVLATVAVKIAARGGRAVILSTDKSMLTLLRPGIRVHDHFHDRELDEGYVRERFGVAPGALATWLALVGESSQHVPGVKSVGPKTATRLIAGYGELEAILAAAPELPGRTGTALREHADDARLSLRLSTLRTDVEVGINLSECRLAPAAEDRE